MICEGREILLSFSKTTGISKTILLAGGIHSILINRRRGTTVYYSYIIFSSISTVIGRSLECPERGRSLQV
jgi:hypothetical protein